MHNLLVACAEIDQDDLNCYRSTQDAAPPPPAVPPAAPGPATPPPFVDAINLDDLDLPDDDTIVGPPTLPLPDLPELAGPPTPRGTRDSEAAVAVAEQDEIEFREALAWATSSTDDVLLLSLRRSLPEAVLDEQVRAYRARSAGPAAVAAPEPPATKLFVRPLLLSHRMSAAAAYDAYLRSLGWDNGDRAPRNALTRFVTRFLSF